MFSNKLLLSELQKQTKR